MAKNRNTARDTTPSAAATTQASATSTSSKPAAAAPPASSTPAAVAAAKSASPLATTTGGNAKHNNNGWEQVVQSIANHYIKETPQRTKLLDAFMAFLVAVGALQFLYCVLAGNYPFNAFLSGFSATVGQFVLTASLRIQTTEANKSDFPAVSPERAFADFVFCSLILHFFCVNFIN
ncbi:DAD family-domain-containing protein [Podospora appendiculata]|uniref:Dolichyl-diphosphooligosaccharide--protein glycosyltransferase subunit OST2 n=1 Tax=Podospora appendiculata TaxID=314037 RepID=A0AAE0XL26_9PEZI|nr:DAD family-domain-containing protein [Podospora appendiculata]